MNVRMWLATAHGSLGDPQKPGRWLFRGSQNDRVDEAVDAIGKMRLAYLDLEHALHRADMDGPSLATLHLEMFRSIDFGLVKVRLSGEDCEQLRAAVAGDLMKIDALVAAIEALQRAPRET